MESYRQKGDTLADSLISSLYEIHQSKLGAVLMPFLHDFSRKEISNQDQITQDFFLNNKQIPSFFSIKSCTRSTDFFNRHQQTIGVILGCYSLPYCYLGEDGARVLEFSGRIKSETYNRLKETGQFLKRTMNFDHWETGDVVFMLLKVRLLHAFWRFMILKSGKWNSSWGYPINQEDMLGTNLSFSWIVLKGLRKLGYDVDKVYEDSYLMHWAAVGLIMGLDEKLLVFSNSDAIKMDKIIAKRQFRPSVVGKELTNALFETFIKMAGSTIAGEFFKSQSRFLLGNQYSDWLGIPKSTYPISLLTAFNKSSSFLSNIYA